MIRTQATSVQTWVAFGALAALVGGAALAADAGKPSFEALDKTPTAR